MSNHEIDDLILDKNAKVASEEKNKRIFECCNKNFLIKINEKL